jgi:cobaltochelatase CobT
MNITETQKQAIKGCIVALSGRQEIDISYRDNYQLHINNFADSVVLPADCEFSELRAVADLAALALRFHDVEIHAELEPEAAKKKSIFDEFALLRLVALGLESLQGVKQNIEVKLRSDLAIWQDEKLSLPNLARDFLLNRQDSKFKFAGTFALINDQIAYSKKVNLLIDKFLVEGKTSINKPTESQLENLKVTTSQSEKNKEEVRAELEAKTQKLLSQTDGKQEEPTQNAEQTTKQKQYGGKGQISGSGEAINSKEFVAYKSYSNEFDEIVKAAKLTNFNELSNLWAEIKEKMKAIGEVDKRKVSLFRRKLAAQKYNHEKHHLEDGMIDSRKLPLLIANPNYKLLYKHISQDKAHDSCVTILLDNSGSMNGKPINTIIHTTALLSNILEQCGVKNEVLGFTTKTWHGGKSRELWQKNGSPDKPGRLNDIRHIIYKAFDNGWRSAKRNLALMAKEGVLKENIDGEALLWAAHRLRRQPEKRKILIILSDGAPVDDATLSNNSASYLDDHLKAVIHHLQSKTNIELLALGIGHNVDKLYANSLTLNSSDELKGRFFEKMAELF